MIEDVGNVCIENVFQLVFTDYSYLVNFHANLQTQLEHLLIKYLPLDMWFYGAFELM